MGGAALQHQAENGPSRMVKGIIFDGDDFALKLHRDWPVVDADGNDKGYIGGVAPSVHVGRPIGIGTLDKSVWEVGTALIVQTPDGPRSAKVAELPFRP